MEIIAVDSRMGEHFVGSMFGPIAGWLYENHLQVTSTRNMVDGVLAKAGGQKISLLHIVDHGSPNGLEIGGDWISLSSLAHYRTDLGRLRGHFARDGVVYLHHCNVGQNEELMKRLAWIFDAKVYAGTSYSLPPLRWNLGGELRCNAYKCTPPPSSSPWDNPNKMCCFPAGVVVHTPRGASAIERLDVGDLVWSWNAEKRSPEPAPSTGVDIHDGQFELYGIHTGDERPTLVTATHRFANCKEEWVPSELIRENFVAKTLSGTSELQGAQLCNATAFTVYNLRIAANRSYFVGEPALLVRDH